VIKKSMCATAQAGYANLSFAVDRNDERSEQSVVDRLIDQRAEIGIELRCQWIAESLCHQDRDQVFVWIGKP
jgi:hypothetical protein